MRTAKNFDKETKDSSIDLKCVLFQRWTVLSWIFIGEALRNFITLFCVNHVFGFAPYLFDSLITQHTWLRENVIFFRARLTATLILKNVRYFSFPYTFSSYFDVFSLRCEFRANSNCQSKLDVAVHQIYKPNVSCENHKLPVSF